MPNEIFDDFPSLIEGGSSKIAFAYSFYYLITYLYRFAKYGGMNGCKGKYDIGTLKEILQYSRDNNRIQPIIKEGGVLDEMGYTKSSYDYPVEYRSFDEFGHKLDDPEIIMWSDFINMYQDEVALDDQNREHMIKSLAVKEAMGQQYREYKIKVPLKAFDRDEDKAGIQVGTFYQTDFTTTIPVSAFLKCMADETLGTTAFYIYSFLKYQSERYQGHYDASRKRLIDESGISKSTVDQTLKTLEELKMIVVERGEWKNGQVKMANSYRVNDSLEWF